MNLIILGAGGFGKVVEDVASSLNIKISISLMIILIWIMLLGN